MKNIKPINALMTSLGQWALVTVMYILLYTGANEGLWPLVAHFRHHDGHVPNLVDIGISSVLFPLLIGYLLAATLRWRPSAWCFLLAPALLMVAAKYMSDALYPPFWSEFLSLLAAGAIQGVSAWTGWFLYQRWAFRKQVKQSVSGEGAHGVVVTHY